MRDLELAEDEGVMEVSHLLFLDDGVIGAEYNHRGPKVTVLPRYLRSKSRSLPAIATSVLLRQGAHQQLREMTMVASVEIEISRSNLAICRASADTNATLFDSFEASIAPFEADNIRIMVGREPWRRTHTPLAQIPIVGRLARDASFLSAARTFRVKGLDPQGEQDIVLDLLSEQIVSQVRVAKIGRTRVVVTSAMFDGILAAYESLRDEIQDASVASLA